jgi:hypothetical protein
LSFETAIVLQFAYFFSRCFQEPAGATIGLRATDFALLHQGPRQTAQTALNAQSAIRIVFVDFVTVSKAALIFRYCRPLVFAE